MDRGRSEEEDKVEVEFINKGDQIADKVSEGTGNYKESDHVHRQNELDHIVGNCVVHKEEHTNHYEGLDKVQWEVQSCKQILPNGL